MHEKMIRQFNSDVAEALSARRAAGITSRKAALALLKAPGWAETLNGLLPIRRRLTCACLLYTSQMWNPSVIACGDAS